jgi:hypothetical protein
MDKTSETLDTGFAAFEARSCGEVKRVDPIKMSALMGYRHAKNASANAWIMPHAHMVCLTLPQAYPVILATLLGGNVKRCLALTYDQDREMLVNERLSEITGVAASTRTPMNCFANICPGAPTSPGSLRPSLTPLLSNSIPGHKRVSNGAHCCGVSPNFQ